MTYRARTKERRARHLGRIRTDVRRARALAGVRRRGPRPLGAVLRHVQVVYRRVSRTIRPLRSRTRARTVTFWPRRPRRSTTAVAMRRPRWIVVEWPPTVTDTLRTRVRPR